MPDSINVNDFVWVILTDYGRTIYRRYWTALGSNLGSIQDPTVLKNQLWLVMKIFGSYMRLGDRRVFEDGCIHFTEPKQNNDNDKPR